MAARALTRTADPSRDASIVPPAFGGSKSNLGTTLAVVGRFDVFAIIGNTSRKTHERGEEMRNALIIICVLGTSSMWGGIGPDPVEILRRGDANNDGVVNVTDAQYIASYLYQGGPDLPCVNQGDANDDGALDGSDISYITNWLFNGGPQPPAPGPYNSTCAADTTTPNLSCYAGCP